MKTTKFFALLFSGLLLAASLMAQPPMSQFKGRQPGQPPAGKAMAQLQLTDKQQSQIAKLRLDMQKEMLPLRDQVHSLQTQYRLMVIDPKVSKADLQKQLNKISAVRQKMALKRAEHQRQVRSLLTDEQKLKFDQHFLSAPKKGRMGRRGGMHGPHGHRPMR